MWPRGNARPRRMRRRSAVLRDGPVCVDHWSASLGQRRSVGDMTTYRVIQWATGSIGQISIQSFARNPQFELVGCYVTSSEKVGRDAGELAGIDPVGVIATDNVDEILALDAD